MKMDGFELEHFLTRHEHAADVVLGTSGLATLPADALPARIDSLDYGPMPAEPRLVHAIAAARYVPEEEVLVTVGGTEALFLAPFVLVESGKRVLVETPTYPPLLQVPRALGARVETFERRFEDDWHFDVDALIARLDDDVAYVALTNPNNPTGRLTSSSDLVRIARACEAVDAWLLVDDIFRPLVQPTPSVSRLLHPRIVTAESLTKCHGLSGLRTGWLIAPEALRDRFREAKALTSLVNAAPAQAFAIQAIHREDALLARGLRVTHENMARFKAFAKRWPQLAWRAPDAPLITALRLPEGEDDVAFCERLLEETRVLLVPGAYLGLPGFVRMGFGAQPEACAEGLERLDRHLTSIYK